MAPFGVKENTIWSNKWNRLLNVTAVLTVGLQQLLLGGDGERAIFGRQHHSQANVVLLWGSGPTDNGQQSHRVGLRSRAEALHAEPGGVAKAWRRREQALPWRWKRKGGKTGCSSGISKTTQTHPSEALPTITCKSWYCIYVKWDAHSFSPQICLQDHWCTHHIGFPPLGALWKTSPFLWDIFMYSPSGTEILFLSVTSGQTACLLLFCCCQHLLDITAKMELELSAIWQHCLLIVSKQKKCVMWILFMRYSCLTLFSLILLALLLS